MCVTENYFSYFSTKKTYVVGTQKNRFNETVLLSTQNIYLDCWVRKQLFFLHSKILLNWSYGQYWYFNSLRDGYFSYFCYLLLKIHSGTLSECQTVWIQIRTAHLIWVQSVCKGQKLLLARKKLMFGCVLSISLLVIVEQAI